MNIPYNSLSPKDKKSFFLLSLLLFNIFTSIIMGENAVESLLISNIGAAILPKMYIINAFFLFLVSFIFLPVIDRIERGRFFYSSSVVFGAIILVSRFLVFLEIRWIYPFLYIFSYTAKTVLFIIFWTIANDISDTRQAKTTFPMIAGMGILGNTFASFLTGYTVKYLHTENLLFVWALLLFSGMAIFRVLHNAHKKQLMVSDFIRGVSKTVDEVRSDFTTVRREPLLQIMALIFFITFLFLFNIDFQFYRTAGLRYSQVDQLTSFLGYFKGTYSTVTFILQFFIVSTVFNRFGISKSMLIVPITFILIALFLFGAGMGTPDPFWPIVIGTFVRFVVFESIFSPTYQIFFSSLKKNLRGKGKAFIEAIIKPIAILCSGLVIISFAGILGGYIYLLLALAAGGLLYATLKLKNWYTESLIKTVAGVHYDDFRSALLSFSDKLDAEILPFLAESLRREENINVKLFIIEMIGQVKAEESNGILLKAFEEFKNPWLRASIVSSMRNLRVKENLTFFIERLNDRDHRIRANAIEAITELQVRNVYRIIEHYAESDPQPRVRANALISLYALYSDPAQRQAIITRLEAMLESDDPQQVSRGLYILGQLRDQQFIDLITTRLDHASPAVRRSVIEALSRLRTQKSYRTLIRALDILPDESDRNLVTAKMVDIGPALIDTILENLKPENRLTTYLLLNSVHRILRENSEADRQTLLGFAERDKLTSLALEEVEYVYQRRFLIFSLKNSSDPTITFLAGVLREKSEIQMATILEVLSILDPSHKISSATRRLKDIDEHVQADIFELLENIGHPEIIEPFIPLLEEDDERIRSLGKRRFGLTLQPLAQVVRSLLDENDRWIQAVAIHTAGRVLQLSEDRSIIRMLKALADDSDPLIRDLASRALKEKSKTIIKSITTKGEKTMLDKDLLKGKFTIVERVIFFKKLPLFKNVDSERLKLFAEIASEQVYRRGDLIVRENDIGEFLYIVKSGRIDVVKNYGKNETVLSQIGEMGYFGEMGLIDNEPRSASCVASVDCSLLVIGKEDFLDVLYRSPEISLELFKLFTQRIREGNEKIKILTQEIEKKKTVS